ncbi:putative bifunctional diguanylate cyclase/phosphodiesterase [Roseibium sp. M-1]
MTPTLFKDIWVDTPGENVRRLRQSVSRILLWYFWISAAVPVLATYWTSGSTLYVALPLTLIGVISTLAVLRDPAGLSTRLTMTVAINSTWMFGLYVASDIHGGEYMLEVHMLYFINTSIILAYVCWRSVLMTTIAALAHHSILTVLYPELVWPSSDYAWWHLLNHYSLGTVNCIGGIFIAVMLKRFLDNMERLKIEAQHRSIHDDLTGLLNRRGLRQSFEELVGTGGARSDVTLFQLDLDGFKGINDTAGHAAGDRLLVLVAELLRSIAPQNSVISRIGGDEFVVVSPAIDPLEERKFVSRLESWTQRAHPVASPPLRVGASTGITNSMLSGGRLDTMMIDADIALYEAKKAGKNRALTFSPRMKTDAQTLHHAADEIVRALENGEFEPYFQTQHDCLTGAIVGVEVLARWLHPERGVLGPAEFLNAVNVTGKAAVLDEHILTRALERVAALEHAGFHLPKVSFNVSFQRLSDPGLIPSLTHLQKVRADIAFELVESVFFDNLNSEEIEAVKAMRENGIQIEIDDFGTGHASIVALTRLKPDLIKIDRALISPIAKHPEQLQLVKAIVEMARGLGIECLAEGVESREDIHLLRSVGVNYVQGYAFSKPVSIEGLQGYLLRASA